jgi:predicted metalloprotease
VAPGPDRARLQHVLGLVPVAQQAQQERRQAQLVAIEQHPQGDGVAGAEALHQQRVGGFRHGAIPSQAGFQAAPAIGTDRRGQVNQELPPVCRLRLYT